MPDLENNNKQNLNTKMWILIFGIHLVLYIIRFGTIAVQMTSMNQHISELKEILTNEPTILFIPISIPIIIYAIYHLIKKQNNFFFLSFS